MPTVTLTEFNRRPSRVAAMARTEDVIVTDRGAPALELRSIGQPVSRLDHLRRSGKIRPARDRSAEPAPDFEVDPVLAARLYAAFEAERGEGEF